MSEKQRSSTIIKPELVHELSETVATLTRLGLTLANLPITLLPDKEREKAKQMTNEAIRIGTSLPRAVGSMLEEMTDEGQSAKKEREDLGTRLRRQREQMENQPSATNTVNSKQ